MRTPTLCRTSGVSERWSADSSVPHYAEGVTTAPSPIKVGSNHERKYPGADSLATECVINLVRAESLVIGVIRDVLRGYGLSPATFNVLMILDGAGGELCPHEIGDRLLVTRGTVTGLLDSLERQGHITRSVHPDDRRMFVVRMTKKGRKLLTDLLPEFFPVEAQMMSVLSPREKETLVRLLGKVESHLSCGPLGS